MSVRVRFAPSPTGFLHIGGLRTALYNYLFARKNKGKFILRIEDTDRSRYVENAVENLIKSLRWAGIDYDEGPVLNGEFGPYFQSERLDKYSKYCKTLIDNGAAYYAFDTPEEIQQMRDRLQESKSDPKYDRLNMKNQLTINDDETKRLISGGSDYVIRLKVPDGKDIKFKDIIRGDISVPSKDIDDQVLMKSDGFPTYHLANVVDDHLMEISHVIRGEEWLPSTPKHIILYEAFGWNKPKFAHLPLLLNEKKQKLSKRHGDVAVEDFKEKGYLRDAFVNFISLLGWNPSGDREIYTIDELIDAFDLTKINKGGAVFDNTKLEWMNAQYLKTIPENELVRPLRIEIKKKNLTLPDDSFLSSTIKLFKERVTFIHQIPDYAKYMFTDDFEYDEKYMQKKWLEDTLENIKPLVDLYRQTDDFAHDNLYTITKDYAEKNDLKIGFVIHPIRLMITGQSIGAGMFETMEVLGKDNCIKRFDKFIKLKEDGII